MKLKYFKKVIPVIVIFTFTVSSISWSSFANSGGNTTPTPVPSSVSDSIVIQPSPTIVDTNPIQPSPTVVDTNQIQPSPSVAVVNTTPVLSIGITELDDSTSIVSINKTYDDIVNFINLINLYSPIKTETSINYDKRTEDFTLVSNVILDYPDIEQKNELIRLFAITMTDFASKSFSLLDAVLAEDFILLMPAGGERTSLSAKNLITKKTIIQNIKDDPNTRPNTIPQDWLDEYSNDGHTDIDYLDNPPINTYPKTDEEIANDIEKANQVVSSSDQYAISGTKCYKTTTKKLVNGKTKKVKILVKGPESAFCQFKPVTPKAEHNTNANGETITDLRDLNNNPLYNNLDDWLTDNDMKASNTTLQFTLNKESIVPMYFDTGIRVPKNNNLTYDEIKNAVYQLSYKLKGINIDDSEKFMTLIDGKILVIKNENKLISVTALESKFKDKTYAIKALPTQIGTNKEYVYMKINQVNKILFNNKEFTIANNISTTNSNIMFPLNEIYKIIGATATSDGNKLIYELNGNKIVYEIGKNIAIVNNKEITLNSIPQKNTLNVVLGEIEQVFKQLNIKIIWDDTQFIITL